MPAERSIKNAASAGRRILKNVEPCIICGKVVCRTSDIARHMKKHDSEAKKLACPWEGCSFSALQRSNLDTHYRRHTQDKSYLCEDDPNCHFKTVDPACLLRHRKRMHAYIPKPSNRRKTGEPSKTQAISGPESSIDSSVKLASSTFFSLFNEPAPPPTDTSNLLPLNESFINHLYPCSYDYKWDAPPQSELLATQSETRQLRSLQDQQENWQQLENWFSLQFPNTEEIFPGYGTTGKLYGSYGLKLNPVFAGKAQPSPGPETSTDPPVKLPSSTLSSLFNEPAPPPMATSNLLPLNESFSNNFYPCAYDYAWNALPQSESLATQSEIQQFGSDQWQQPENLFPLQFPNAGQIFLEYGTTGQLYGSYGLDLNSVL